MITLYFLNHIFNSEKKLKTRKIKFVKEKLLLFMSKSSKVVDLTGDINNILLNTVDLEELSKNIEKISLNIDDNNYQLQKAHLEHNYSVYSQNSDKTKKDLDNIIDFINDLIQEKENIRKSQEIEVPTHKQLATNFQNLCKTQLPQKHPPYTPLCGKIPWPKDQILPVGSYACMPREDDFMLVYVIHYNHIEGSYTVVDADPEVTDAVTKFTVKPVNVTPIPTSYPSKRSKTNTFQAKDRVLALYLDSNGYTTVFYPAVVVSAPGNNSTFYKLKFDGDTTAIEIPEKFVIPAFKQ